jgi:hypothetical protein
MLLLLLVFGLCHLPAWTGRGISTLASELDADLRLRKPHLVVIAIHAYRRWPVVRDPVKDAREIEKIVRP